MWKKKFGSKATYGSLLRALLEGKCAGGAANKIVDILNNPGEPSMASNLETDHHSATSSGSSSVELPPVDLGPYFPYLPTEGRSEEEVKPRQMKLYEETVKIKKAFAGVVFDLMRNVEQEHKLEEVTTLLKSYDNSFEKLLKDCKTPGEVFDKISSYVSFFNYEIIKLLGRKLGSVAVKKKLFKYKKKFQEYSKRRVCECPCNAFGKKEDSEVVYVIKTDRSLTTLTVEEVDKLQYNMNRILGRDIDNKPLLKLLSIEEGCVQLEFRSLQKVNCLKISITDQVALKKFGVISVCYGDHLINMSEDEPAAIKDNGNNSLAHDNDSGFRTGSATTETVEKGSGGVNGAKSDSTLYHQVKDLNDPRLHMMEEGQDIFPPVTFDEFGNRRIFERAEVGDISPEKLLSLSLLQIATLHNDLEGVRALVEGQKENPLNRDANNDTLLHYAAMNGKLDILKYLIEDRGCNPSSKGFLGGSVLHAAARSKQLHVVKYLVEDYKLDPTSDLDDLHQSTLAAACFGGDLDIVKCLIENMREYMDLEDAIYTDWKGQLAREPEIDHEIQLDYDSFQQEPLACACLNGHLPVVKYLVEECGCNPLRLEGNQNRPALEAAVYGNQLEVLEYLANTEYVRTATSYKSELPLVFHATRKSNTKLVIYLVTKLQCDPFLRFNGYAPIHVAAIKGNLEIFKYFIEILDCASNIKVEGRNECESIHLASKEGHLDIVKYLLEKCSCNPTMIDDMGRSPLYIAAMNGHLDLVRYLTAKHKCDPMQQNETQLSSVHAAAIGGHVSVLRHFFEKMWCDPNQQGQYACQPIHYAAGHGHLDVLRYLINEQKVDPESVDIHHQTALFIAVLCGHNSLVRYLIEQKKCNVHITNFSGATLLEMAVHGGRLELLKYLVKFINPREVAGNGNDLLHYASLGGHLDIMKYLISEVGLDKDFVDREGLTSLSRAAHKGHLPIVKYLLEIGSVHQDRYQYSPLDYAACKGHFEVVKFLMNSYPDMYTCNAEQSPLNSAVLGGQLHIVKYLIEKRKINKKDRLLISFVARTGHLAIMKYLVESLNYDPSLDFIGVHPIHHAAETGHLNIIKYLVEDQKCDPNVLAHTSRPIHFAALGGHLQVVKYLVEDQKCALNLPSGNGSLPFHMAVARGHLELVKYFVEELKCNPNLPDPEGKQPIHCAAVEGQLEVLRYLVEEQKCDPNLPWTNNDNRKPIHLAAYYGHLNVVKYLVDEQKVNPSATNDLHATALHVTSKAGHLDIVKYLAGERRCGINITDINGHMPIHIATVQGHFNIIEYLVKELHCDPDVPTLSSEAGEAVPPIFMAVKENNLKMVRFLVEVAGSNPSHWCVSGPQYAPLRLAYDRYGIRSDIFLYLAMVMWSSL